MKFANRSDAGRQLSQALLHLRGERLVVLGIPRGGVPVAIEVSRAIDAPLDVVVVRKIGMPLQPELAMGAVSENGTLIVDRRLAQDARVTGNAFSRMKAEQMAEVESRVQLFRSDHPKMQLGGIQVVIVDDGAATGATAFAACEVARQNGATRITVALPVCSCEAAKKLAGVADEVVCLTQPIPFFAVGQHYFDFTPTTDTEVISLLALRAEEIKSRQIDRSSKTGDLRIVPSINNLGHHSDTIRKNKTFDNPPK